MINSVLVTNLSDWRQPLTRISLVLILMIALLGQSWSINMPFEGAQHFVAAFDRAVILAPLLNDVDDESRNLRALPILIDAPQLEPVPPRCFDGHVANRSADFSGNRWQSCKLNIVLLI